MGKNKFFFQTSKQFKRQIATFGNLILSGVTARAPEHRHQSGQEKIQLARDENSMFGIDGFNDVAEYLMSSETQMFTK